MTLTAEESAALAADEPNETDTEEAPASTEQPTTEVETTPAEGDAATEPSEAEGDKADEKKPEEPNREQQRAWRQVEAAKKAQVQIARARQQLEQDVQRVRSYETDLHTQATQIAQREARIKPLEEALANRDLNALVALGFDYDGFTRHQIEANTPEGIAKRALEENRKLREEREAEKRQAEQAAQANAQIAETRQAAHALVQLVDEYGASDYPELFVWAPERIANEGLEIRAAYYRRNRAMPTYGVVLNELQRRAKAEADVHAQRTTALQQRRSGKSSDAGSAGKVDLKGNSGSPGLPALNARGSSDRGAPPPRQKTEEEIDAECLAELRALRR